MKLKLIPLLLLPALMLLVACGGVGEPLPDIEATVEARVAEERAAVATVETKPEAIAKTMGEATILAVPQAATEVPVLTADCILDGEQLKVSCQAIGYQTGSQLTWTSTASWAYSEGSQWQFIIDEELIAPTAQVSLEECKASICTTTTTSIDTSALVPQDTTYSTASAAPSRTPASDPTTTTVRTSTSTPLPVPKPSALLVLPFTMEHEPTGMMPMGETVHHAREAPWGHPGIDFQWFYKAPIVIALGGEVVQIVEIVSIDSKQPELLAYSVGVITNDLIANYEVIEPYSVNPSLNVGSQVVAGQMIGYAMPSGGGGYMTHWTFGIHRKNDNFSPSPEGIVMLYYTEYLCPVPYFTEAEQQRLSQIWEIAAYNERDQFPELCNGPYKNYPTIEPIRVSETSSSSPSESPENTSTEKVEFPGCKGKGPIEFDQSPMRYEDFAAIQPYGLLAGAHVTPIDHMYFTPMDRSLGRDSYEVRAIADGVLWDLGPRDVHTDTGEKKKREWRMVFAHTCTFHSYFDLLTSLSPDILAEWEATQGETNRRWNGIPIKSGQVVGRIGGQTLDFGVYDYEIVLDGFIFPEHYDREPWKIHTVDPFPYFPADVREVLLQKNLRKVEPVAGKIDHDIDGKLTGNWFEVDTNWYAGKDTDRYFDGHLAIVPNHIDPTAWMFSTGHWTGEETSSGAANFIIVGAEPNPKNVGINEGIVKYELAEYWYCLVDDIDNCSKSHTPAKQLLARPTPQNHIGIVLVQMIEDRLLKVEAFPGKKITEVEGFTSAAKLYER